MKVEGPEWRGAAPPLMSNDSGLALVWVGQSRQRTTTERSHGQAGETEQTWGWGGGHGSIGGRLRPAPLTANSAGGAPTRGLVPRLTTWSPLRK